MRLRPRELLSCVSISPTSASRPRRFSRAHISLTVSPLPATVRQQRRGKKGSAGSPHGPVEFRVRGLLDLGGSFGGGDALHGARQRMAGRKPDVGPGTAGGEQHHLIWQRAVTGQPISQIQAGGRAVVFVEAVDEHHQSAAALGAAAGRLLQQVGEVIAPLGHERRRKVATPIGQQCQLAGEHIQGILSCVLTAGASQETGGDIDRLRRVQGEPGHQRGFPANASPWIHRHRAPELVKASSAASSALRPISTRGANASQPAGPALPRSSGRSAGWPAIGPPQWQAAGAGPRARPAADLLTRSRRAAQPGRR